MLHSGRSSQSCGASSGYAKWHLAWFSTYAEIAPPPNGGHATSVTKDVISFKDNQMKKAKKTDWKNTPMPNEFILLPETDIKYNFDEYNKIGNGLIPECMEDKWFMYLENDTLYCHRSWTGIILYEVHFIKNSDSISIEKILLNSQAYKPDKEIDIKYELEMLLFLVNRMLLGKNVEFPVDPTIKIDNNMQYMMKRHGAVGNSSANTENE